MTDILLTIQYATGYANVKWTDTMSIMINLTGGGTLWGQSLSKTAVGITLLRLSDRTQTYILWFCIFTMNSYMIIKFFFIWARFCGKSNYDVVRYSPFDLIQETLPEHKQSLPDQNNC